VPNTGIEDNFARYFDLFSDISCRECSFHLTLRTEFSVEWFLCWKWIYWKPSEEMSVRYQSSVCPRFEIVSWTGSVQHFQCNEVRETRKKTFSVLLVLVHLSILLWRMGPFNIERELVRLRSTGVGIQGWRLSRFQWHEATNSLSSLPWMGC